MRCTRLTIRLSVLALAVAATAAACGGGSAADAGPADACTGSTACGDPCNFGNSWGVGRYCTPGGMECADTPSRLAPFCTADYDEDAPVWFCTRPCETEDQCGEAAACTGETSDGPKGCVPVSCVNDGADAGAPDALTADAG